MKKHFLFIAGLLFSAVLFSSCFHDHDLHIRINDNDDVYRLRATYNEDLSDDVQRVINKHLRMHHSETLVGRYTDKEIRLQDGTYFYVKTGPGRLRIKIDRDENSEESCQELEAMCDEIKEMLAQKEEHE